jgi:hypothetical protein
VIGAIGILAFIFIEMAMKDDALIPLKLFRSSTFSMATVIGVFVGFGMFGAMLTLPLYLQLVLGSTPTESGLQLLPMILGLMVSSIASGQIIARTGRYRMFPILGTLFLAGGFFYLTFLKYDTGYWFIAGAMLLIGLGLGQLMQTLTIASQNSVGLKDMGVATSASTFFRQIGGTLGTAVLLSLLFTLFPTNLTAAFKDDATLSAALNAALDPAVANAPENKQIMELAYDKQVTQIKAGLPAGVDLSNDQVRAGVVDNVIAQIKANPSSSAASAGTAGGGALDDTSFLNGADPRLAKPFLQGFSASAVSVYYVALIVVLIAFVLSLFFKTPPLRAKSALQEAADDAEADAKTTRDRVAAVLGASADEDEAELDTGILAHRAADDFGALIEPGADTASLRAQRPKASPATD